MAKTNKAKSNDNLLKAEISYFKQRKLLYFVSVLTVGIFLRLIWVLLIKCTPVSDFAYYFEVATNLAAGNGFIAWGYPTAWQGIGYPLLLGSSMRLIGNYGLLFAKLFNVALSTLTLITAFFIFRKLAPEDRRVSNFAITLLIFFPSYIAYNTIVGAEITLTFVFSLILLLQLYDLDSNQEQDKGPLKEMKPVYFGIMVAIVSLMKPYFILYPIVIGFAGWLKNKDIKKAITKTVIIFVTALVVISPWIFRNYSEYKRLVFITYNSGFTLYVNNNDMNNWGGWMDITKIPKKDNFRRALASYGYSDEKEEGPKGGQVMRDPRLSPVLRNEALKWIVKHPLQFVELGLIRINNLLFSGAKDVRDWSMVGAFPNPTMKQSRAINLLTDYSSLVLVLLSMCGIIYSLACLPLVIRAMFDKGLRIQPRYSIPILNLIMFAFVAFIFEGQPRNCFPLFILFAFAASYIAATVYDSLKYKKIC